MNQKHTWELLITGLAPNLTWVSLPFWPTLTMDLFAKWLYICCARSGCFSLMWRLKFPVPVTEPDTILPQRQQIALTLSPSRILMAKNFPSKIFGSVFVRLLFFLWLEFSLTLANCGNSDELLSEDSTLFSGPESLTEFQKYSITPVTMITISIKTYPAVDFSNPFWWQWQW